MYGSFVRHIQSRNIASLVLELAKHVEGDFESLGRAGQQLVVRADQQMSLHENFYSAISRAFHRELEKCWLLPKWPPIIVRGDRQLLSKLAGWHVHLTFSQRTAVDTARLYLLVRSWPMARWLRSITVFSIRVPMNS